MCLIEWNQTILESILQRDDASYVSWSPNGYEFSQNEVQGSFKKAVDAGIAISEAISTKYFNTLCTNVKRSLDYLIQIKYNNELSYLLRRRGQTFCKCSGTTALVHEKCLLKWIQVSKNKDCEICHTPFIFHTKRIFKPSCFKTFSQALTQMQTS